MVVTGVGDEFFLRVSYGIEEIDAPLGIDDAVIGGT
jgi:hypothetical protein